MNISTSELLEAVKSATGAHANPDDAWTRSEIAEALGNGMELTSKKLSLLKAAGLLECVKVMREDLCGRMHPQPAYRFVKRVKAKR